MRCSELTVLLLQSIYAAHFKEVIHKENPKDVTGIILQTKGI
jgi:hypothetical protein